MGRPRINLESKEFGRWKVFKYLYYERCRSYYLCLCKCGKTKTVDANTLKNGESKSCGCYAIDVQHKRANPIKQLLTNVFKSMHARCYNPKNDNYSRYGGRGISVCKEWHDRDTFIDFALKNGWQHGLQTDRINNDGNYEPSNIRFVTPSENMRNSTNMNRKRNAKGQYI